VFSTLFFNRQIPSFTSRHAPRGHKGSKAIAVALHVVKQSHPQRLRLFHPGFGIKALPGLAQTRYHGCQGCREGGYQGADAAAAGGRHRLRDEGDKASTL